MDFGATLSRALKITRENKVLWLLGFLAALGGAANAFGNGSGSGWRFDSRDLVSGMGMRGLPMTPSLSYPVLPCLRRHWVVPKCRRMACLLAVSSLHCWR